VAGDRVTVRELSGIAEMTVASSLWDTIWLRDEAGHEVDPALMVAVAHAGGYLAGAFDGSEMVGASLGFWGSPDYGALHSHITGVRPGATGQGVGTAIKLHQRAWVLERGGTAITWTYDPLVARNAHVNINRLGARPERYLLDVYGEMTDELNRGDPSDRLLVRWSLTRPAAAPSARPAVPLVTARNDAPVAGVGLEDLDPVIAALTIAVPVDIMSLRRRDPATAAMWRHAVRESLATLLDRGWQVTGFERSLGYRLEVREP
jgi:predicted GNAT superfamily acetyltransferase